MAVRKTARGMTAPLLLLAACGPGARKVEPSAADALAQIREQVDGQRQCAPLLSGTAPIEFSADALAGPRVDALVAAGLVRRMPLPDRGDRPRLRIEPTEAGARDIWMRRLDPSGRAEPFLCYGRKQVVAVRRERRDIGSDAGDPMTGDVLRYDYRVVEAPGWTARPDIRAAFPFLPRELERVRTAEQAARLSNGAWELAGETGPDAGGELAADEGFFPN